MPLKSVLSAPSAAYASPNSACHTGSITYTRSVYPSCSAWAPQATPAALRSSRREEPVAAVTADKLRPGQDANCAPLCRRNTSQAKRSIAPSTMNEPVAAKASPLGWPVKIRSTP